MYHSACACITLHPFAAVALDGAGAILAANPQMQSFIASRADLFRSSTGRLEVADAAAQKKLAAALADLAPGGRRTIPFASPTASSGTNWLVVERLPDVEPPASSSEEAAPLFRVSFRSREGLADLVEPERLMADLDLTRVEATITAALVEGLSPAECAGRLGTQLSTIRWHLTNIRRKLGCSSQRDIVRTVLLISM
jgi:DNA-binding CsgD family transcriptional regulator